jgi:hypothetical protein
MPVFANANWYNITRSRKGKEIIFARKHRKIQPIDKQLN